MSAVRRVNRRAARDHLSSPYSRPATAPTKKSSWTLSGDRGKNLTEPVNGETQPVADSLSVSVQQQASQDLSNHRSPSIIQMPSPPVPAPVTPVTPNPAFPHSSANATPAENFQIVTSFLNQKEGQPLSPIEADGIVVLIHNSTEPQEERPERFRFSSTPPTPARGRTPNRETPTPSSRKLDRNPNGLYRWEGAGSSARPRSRFRSPAFGSRPSTSRIKLSPPEIPITDTKRRRVDNEPQVASSSRVPATARSAAPSPSVPVDARRSWAFPIPSSPSPAINGASSTGSKLNGIAAPRLRTTGLPKPTAPAIPSPLRQTWGGQSESDSPPPSKPTKAASFMTELIKEVTPPKRPDVSNPYQTASPVKPPAKKPVRRPRATAKPTPPVKAKEPEMSPQAIIEATVPKGSKRSRPPTHLEKPSSLPNGEGPSTRDTPSRPSPQPEPAINGVSRGRKVGSRPPPIVIEEIEEEEEEPVSKKQRMDSVINGFNHKIPNRSVTIEEVDDVDQLSSTPIRPACIIETRDKPIQKPAQPVPSATIPSSTGSSQPGSRGLFGAKSSAPKEPSKLRFSYQPELTSTSTSPPVPIPAPSAQKENAKMDPKDAALKMDVADLPVYSFTVRSAPAIATFRHDSARNAATSAPVSSLPTFNFPVPFKPINGTTRATTASASAPSGFDWAAAGMKPPSNVGTWTCSLCMLANPSSVVDKCKFCDNPREKEEMAKPAATGFDWAAAGMKPPTSDSGTWDCSLCMLKNSTTLNKCGVCDQPR